MTLILRRQHAEDRIDGREPPPDWSDDDYAVVDETLVGRIYRQQVQGDIKWLWFLHTAPAPPPNQGIADTLEEATAALAARYEQVKRRYDGGDRRKRCLSMEQHRLTFARGEFQFCSTPRPMEILTRPYHRAHGE